MASEDMSSDKWRHNCQRIEFRRGLNGVKENEGSPYWKSRVVKEMIRRPKHHFELRAFHVGLPFKSSESVCG